MGHSTESKQNRSVYKPSFPNRSTFKHINVSPHIPRSLHNAHRLFFALAVAIFTVSCINLTSAKEEAVVKSFSDKWRETLPKLKNTGNLRGQITNEEQALVKINAGAKLKPLDTTTSKWKVPVNNLKTSGQLKSVNEAQIAKLTKDVAEEVVKNPSKWRYIKKALEISFGAALTGLIVIGINSMVSQ